MEARLSEQVELPLDQRSLSCGQRGVRFSSAPKRDVTSRRSRPLIEPRSRLGAAASLRARAARVILPALDILPSVPVLGFLSGTADVTWVEVVRVLGLATLTLLRVAGVVVLGTPLRHARRGPERHPRSSATAPRK